MIHNNIAVEKIFLIGIIDNNIKMHSFADWYVVGRFTLATYETQYHRDKNEIITHIELHNIVLLNYLAYFCSASIKKGDNIVVYGSILTKNCHYHGKMLYKNEIFVEKIDFLLLSEESKEVVY